MIAVTCAHHAITVKALWCTSGASDHDVIESTNYLPYTFSDECSFYNRANKNNIIFFKYLSFDLFTKYLQTVPPLRFGNTNYT